jgi:hypothetical protein
MTIGINDWLDLFLRNNEEYSQFQSNVFRSMLGFLYYYKYQ